MGAVLHAVEVPDSGGDTLFADAHAALDELEPQLRERVPQLPQSSVSWTPGWHSQFPPVPPMPPEGVPPVDIPAEPPPVPPED